MDRKLPNARIEPAACSICNASGCDSEHYASTASLYTNKLYRKIHHDRYFICEFFRIQDEYIRCKSMESTCFFSINLSNACNENKWDNGLNFLSIKKNNNEKELFSIIIELMQLIRLAIKYKYAFKSIIWILTNLWKNRLFSCF